MGEDCARGNTRSSAVSQAMSGLKQAWGAPSVSCFCLLGQPRLANMCREKADRLTKGAHREIISNPGLARKPTRCTRSGYPYQVFGPGILFERTQPNCCTAAEARRRLPMVYPVSARLILDQRDMSNPKIMLIELLILNTGIGPALNCKASYRSRV